ncbi:MAG: 4Fe-4S dicluster domain-containing protein [Myxococcota bacterium]
MESSGRPRWLERHGLQRLLDALSERGFVVHGPVVRDGALVFAPVREVAELAVGLRDHQEPGGYRLEPSDDGRVFGIVHGPGALKPFVFAPREPLLQVRMDGPGGDFACEPVVPDGPPVAVIGVRPCDVAALAVQDRIFLGDRLPDAHYAARRARLFTVAVNCTRSVDTCFCTSMGTGPEAATGFDLSLTELDGGFVVRAGSEAGEEVAAALSLPEAPGEACREERRDLDACAQGIGRRLDTSDLPDLLYDNLRHPRWDDVGERCLGCSSCTLVCPTCFCHDQRDEPSLDGKASLRVREWDSCFDPDHSQIHGINFRDRVRDRYRQWLVHKLASWIDQFGSSGCVGCGRCLTWCPVGIDLTEEVAAIRETSGETEPAR